MTSTDLTRAHVGDDRKTGERRPNEVRALSALAFEELRGLPGGIRDMHRRAASRRRNPVGYVDPIGYPVVHRGRLWQAGT